MDEIQELGGPNRPTRPKKPRQHKHSTRQREEHQLRRQAHRNATKQANQEQNQGDHVEQTKESHREQKRDPKFSSYSKSKLCFRRPSGWQLRRHAFSDKDSILQYQVLKAQSQLHSRWIGLPDVSAPDPTGKYFWIRAPNIHFRRLFSRARLDWDFDKVMTELEQPLHDYLGMLYSKGVEYQVQAENLFPYQKRPGRWVLFLGGWHGIPFHANLSKIDADEWKQREMTQHDEIKRIFEEALELYHGPGAYLRNKHNKRSS